MADGIEGDAMGKALRQMFANLNAEALEQLREQRRRAKVHPLTRLLPDYKIETACADPSPEASYAALEAYSLWYDHTYRRAAGEAVTFWRRDAEQRRAAGQPDGGDDGGQAA